MSARPKGFVFAIGAGLPLLLMFAGPLGAQPADRVKDINAGSVDSGPGPAIPSP